MFQIIVRSVCSVLLFFTGILITEKIFDFPKRSIIYKLPFVILFSLITGVLTITDVNNLNTIIFLILQLILHNRLFKCNIYQLIFTSGIFTIILTISDILVAVMLILINTINSVEMREELLISILLNIVVCLISLAIAEIIRKVFCKDKKSKNNLDKDFIKSAFISLVIVFIISSLIESIYLNFVFNDIFFIIISCVVLMIVLFSNYLYEHYKFYELNSKHNAMFQYMMEFEEWVDRLELVNHEYKNNLAVLRGLAKDKKVIDYIDKKLVIDNNVDLSWTRNIKRIPNQNLKSLIYYKMIVARNSNLNIMLEISEKVTKHLKILKEESFKDLSYVFGILMDNAIEAASESEKKELLIEIYETKGEINMVISNTYKERVDLTKISKKGYSTKGQNRGRGLYFVNKIVSNNDNFIVISDINDRYFMQLIIIKQ